MAIQHKRLGKHGALVSNLCLGTMNFGWVTDEAESFRIMDRALELGINFFDTADVYGDGRSERLIAQLRARAGVATADLCDALFAELAAHQGTADQFDDMTMLAVEVH